MGQLSATEAPSEDAAAYLSDVGAADYLRDRYGITQDALRLVQTLARESRLVADFMIGRERRWTTANLDRQVLAGALKR